MKTHKIFKIFKHALIVISMMMSIGCISDPGSSGERIPVILDTDANNELDDQHAIAYLLQNQEVFDILGITVNTTRNGGYIEAHYREAMRILTLFNEEDNIIVKRGADTTFTEIRENLDTPGYDGEEAVDFIIAEARKLADREDQLLLIHIGKLTNIALALEKEPAIADNVRVVWLGTNYPEPGEYNLENDTSALNYLLEKEVHFEIVTVSYGRKTGTSNILVSLPEIDSVMPDLGPQSEVAITGRHGGTYDNFGDYSVNLFHHIDLYGDPPSRSLFDLGAVAVVKNPEWAVPRSIPAPVYSNDGWVDRPGNDREIILWENFDRDSIVNDLYRSLGK
jgi:purine nucleosidase